MTAQQLKTVHEARPFRPFTVHLADGASVDVPRPELLWRTQGGRTIFVNTGGEDVQMIDLLLVTKLTLHNGAEQRRRKR